MRRCFIPRDRHLLLEIDFKAVEVAVAASVTQDPVLMDYVCDPAKDMHRDTAMQLFFLTKEQVDKKTTRDWAKNRFVFPEFYGSVYFQCAPHLWEVCSDPKFKLPGTETSVLAHLKANGIKSLGDCEPGVETKRGTFVHHVKQVEEDFWQRRFKVYTKRKKEWWEAYQRDGGHMIVTGFCIEGLFRRNQIINQKIQGPAFHCALACMIDSQKWLRKTRKKTLLVGTIHDSINYDAHRSEFEDVANDFRERVAALPKKWPWIVVPLSVEVEIAEKNWFEKREWKP